jgi:hypothetical protein
MNNTMKSNVRLECTETRQVHGFERISLCVQNIQNILTIQQGKIEALVIEASSDLLARLRTEVSNGELTIKLAGSWTDLIQEALSTSLTRQAIRYTLTVKQLSALNICGFAHLEVADLEVSNLALRFNGAGSAHFTSLHAGSLEVDLSGAWKAELAGEVARQKLDLRGFGAYYAPKLASQKAVVQLQGSGQATIWVTEQLDAIISGMGRLEYYGSPRIRQKTMPFTGLIHLGNP